MRTLLDHQLLRRNLAEQAYRFLPRSGRWISDGLARVSRIRVDAKLDVGLRITYLVAVLNPMKGGREHPTSHKSDE